MIPELIQQLRDSGKLKWVALAAVLIPVFIIVAILLSKQAFTEHSVVETTLNADRNFSYLSGTNMYAYNGAAFYKIALDSNNAVSILYSGTKLPTPGAIYWANERGALLNFKESFTLTRVEQELHATNIGVSESQQDDTWYLDFSSGSLQRVNDLPVEPNLVVYSEKDKGFYYIPNTPDDKTALRFFNIESNNDQLLAENLKLVDVS